MPERCLLQVTGLIGASRKRTLMLWQAVELSRSMERPSSATLAIARKALEPPDDPLEQVGLMSSAKIPAASWDDWYGGLRAVRSRTLCHMGVCANDSERPSETAHGLLKFPSPLVAAQDVLELPMETRNRRGHVWL